MPHRRKRGIEEQERNYAGALDLNTRRNDDKYPPTMRYSVLDD